MYEQHFGLRTMPFRVVPSPSFLFPSDTHEESRARILYGIRENRGFVVVTGAVGLGKTTVLLSVLDELEDTVRSALVVHPVESFRDLLRMICLEFGIETEHRDEVTLLWELNLFLVEQLAQGTSCVLMIDEAQNLPVQVLERVRTLSNLQTENASLLQIVLVGQPELLTNLDDPRLPQLRQRVGVWHEIGPLGEDDTVRYVHHRLRLAGSGEPERIAPAAVCRRIYGASGGVPRLINQLADTALVIAYGEGAKGLSVDHVGEATRELRLDSTPTPVARPTTVGPAPEREFEPVRPVAASEPGPETERRSNLWLPSLAAVAILVLLLIAAIRFGLLPEWPLSGATASDGEAVPQVAMSEEESEPVEPLGIEEPGTGANVDDGSARPIESRPTPDLWRDTASRVQDWRQGGRSLYTTHLGSFRSHEGAIRFADSLVVQNPEWDTPLYVERTDDDPPWHRVYGGGYLDRTQAQRFASTIKARGQVDFAHVKRLAVAAEELLPSIFVTSGPSNRGESR